MMLRPMVCLAAVALVVLGPLGGARGQSVEQLKAELERVAAGEDRKAMLGRGDEIRARLLVLAPDDERAATWLADRAAVALDQAGLGGLDAVVLLGVPTREQSEQALVIGERALELLTRADAAAAQAVARLESRLLDRMTPLDAATSGDIEKRLRHLVDLEQARRIPYLRALAGTLVAGATRDPARRAALATDAVRVLKDLPAPTAALEASRRATLGMALVAAGEGERQADVLRAAADQFELALEKAGAGDPGLSTRAGLGLVRAGRRDEVSGGGVEASAQREIQQLGFEAQAALALARARTSAALRVEKTSRAVELLLRSAPTPEEVSLGAPDRRALVYQKIAEGIGRDVPLKLLPAEASVARAITLARTAGLSDGQVRGEVLGLLAGVVDRKDTPPALRAQARWEAAVVTSASGDEAREVQALVDVFVNEPESEYAVPAARRVFEALGRRAGGAGGAGAGSVDGAFEKLMPMRSAALDMLIKRDRGDVWRQDGVRLAMAELGVTGEAGSAEMAAAALGRARGYLVGINDVAARQASAVALSDVVYRVVTRRRERVEGAVAADGGKGGWTGVMLMARAAVEHALVDDAGRVPEYALILGEAQLETGDGEAIKTLKGLVDGPIDHPDSALWTRYRLALALAQERGGDTAGAFANLREVADRLEKEPGESGRSRAYWQAWAKMLELQRSGPDAALRAGDMLVQIKRLELIDPLLGGEATAGRIRSSLQWAQEQRGGGGGGGTP